QEEIVDVLNEIIGTRYKEHKNRFFVCEDNKTKEIEILFEPPTLEEKIKDFEMLQKLGNAPLGFGNYGKVWEVSTSKGSPAGVIKITDDIEGKEIEIMKKLKGTPYAAQIEESHVGDRETFIHMPKYMTFKEVLDESKGNIDFQKIVDELVDGLKQIHAKGIVHRDIKPSNIMFERITEPNGTINYKPIFIDFGISEYLKTDFGLVLATAGSPGFMAPECIYDDLIQKHGLDILKKADIWSLGMTILNLFYEKNQSLLSNNAQIKNDFETLPYQVRQYGLSQALQTFVNNLVEKIFKNNQNPTLKNMVKGMGMMLDVNPIERDFSKMLTGKNNKQYQLLERVEQGSSGIVYKAQALDTGEIVAVKVFYNEAERDIESKNMQAFNSDYIVKYIDEGTYRNKNEEMSFVVMEWCNGGDLFDFNRNNYNVPLKILFQVLHGLNIIHQKGFAYIDLKPENMILSNGVVKLSNMASLRKEINPEDILNTSKEFQPQIGDKDKNLERLQQSDIYSVGMILLEWLFPLPQVQNELNTLLINDQKLSYFIRGDMNVRRQIVTDLIEAFKEGSRQMSLEISLIIRCFMAFIEPEHPQSIKSIDEIMNDPVFATDGADERKEDGSNASNSSAPSLSSASSSLVPTLSLLDSSYASNTESSVSQDPGPPKRRIAPGPRVSSLSDASSSSDSEDEGLNLSALENAKIPEGRIRGKNKIEVEIDDKSTMQITTKKELNQGTYGFVFKASIDGDPKEYVLKRIKATDDDEIDKVINEIKLLRKQAANPFISKIISTFYIKNASDDEEIDIYILMPKYLELGEVLWKLANKENNKGYAFIWDFVSRLLEGLASLHASGIFHRDIKVGNNMFKQNGDLIYIDLGITEDTRDPEKTQNCEIYSFQGTPETIAPELIPARDLSQEDAAELLPKADVWSLGITICYVLQSLDLTNQTPPSCLCATDMLYENEEKRFVKFEEEPSLVQRSKDITVNTNLLKENVSAFLESVEWQKIRNGRVLKKLLLSMLTVDYEWRSDIKSLLMQKSLLDRYEQGALKPFDAEEKNVEPPLKPLALKWAVINDRKDIVLSFLQSVDEKERNAIINMQDSNGNTAMHYAASLGNPEIIQILLDYGADMTLVNKEDASASDLANSQETKNMIIKKAMELPEGAIIEGTGDGDAKEPRKYKILKKAQEGSQGIVYKAQALDTGENIAVKVFYKKSDRDIESKNMQKFNSDHIVEYIDEGTYRNKSRNCPFIVMEWCDGGDLFDFNRNNYNVPLKILFQVLHGLNIIHQKGFAYVDLKKENILLHNGQAKLADMASVRQKTKDGEYFPRTRLNQPETLLSGGDFDSQTLQRSDIYSFGTLLWECSTKAREAAQRILKQSGKNLHDGENIYYCVDSLITKQLTKPIQDPLLSLIVRCWMAFEKPYHPQSIKSIDEIINDPVFASAGADEGKEDGSNTSAKRRRCACSLKPQSPQINARQLGRRTQSDTVLLGPSKGSSQVKMAQWPPISGSPSNARSRFLSGLSLSSSPSISDEEKERLDSSDPSTRIQCLRLTKNKVPHYSSLKHAFPSLSRQDSWGTVVTEPDSSSLYCETVTIQGNEVKLGKPIANGSNGIVYNAFITNDSTKYAVKKIKLPCAPKERDKAKIKIENEITIMQRLKDQQCPYIAQIEGYHFDEKAGIAYILMPKYRTFQEVLDESKGKIDFQKIVFELFKGLRVMHDKDIFHRDLKPENIMFDDNGDPIYIDFGYSTNLESTFQEYLYSDVGTPIYLAPELWPLQKCLKPDASNILGRADLWALYLTILEWSMELYGAKNQRDSFIEKRKIIVSELLKDKNIETNVAKLKKLVEDTINSYFKNIKPGDLSDPLNQERFMQALETIQQTLYAVSEYKEPCKLSDILDKFQNAKDKYIRAISKTSIEIRYDSSNLSEAKQPLEQLKKILKGLEKSVEIKVISNPELTVAARITAPGGAVFGMRNNGQIYIVSKQQLPTDIYTSEELRDYNIGLGLSTLLKLVLKVINVSSFQDLFFGNHESGLSKFLNLTLDKSIKIDTMLQMLRQDNEVLPEKIRSILMAA
ncbi:protein kinase, partial [bacterium]